MRPGAKKDYNDEFAAAMEKRRQSTTHEQLSPKTKTVVGSSVASDVAMSPESVKAAKRA